MYDFNNLGGLVYSKQIEKNVVTVLTGPVHPVKPGSSLFLNTLFYTIVSALLGMMVV